MSPEVMSIAPSDRVLLEGGGWALVLCLWPRVSHVAVAWSVFVYCERWSKSGTSQERTKRF